MNHMLTHLPKNRWCPICQETKVKANQARRQDPNVTFVPRRFGDLTLGDHMVLPSPAHWGSKMESAGLLLKDVGTGWRDIFPAQVKSTPESVVAMKEFAGRDLVKEFSSDGSRELKAAAREVKWSHNPGTPHRPTSRGRVEREMQLILEASRCGINASGLPLKW